MKIYTRIKIDIETGKIIEEISYEYKGPVALCGFGSGSSMGADSDGPGGAGFGDEDDFTSAWNDIFSGNWGNLGQGAGGLGSGVGNDLGLSYNWDNQPAFSGSVWGGTGPGPGIGGAGFDLGSFADPNAPAGDLWGGAGFNLGSYETNLEPAVNSPVQTISGVPVDTPMSLEEAQARYDATVAESFASKLGKIGLSSIFSGPIVAGTAMALTGLVEGIKSGWNSYQVQQQIEREFGKPVSGTQAQALIDQVKTGEYDNIGSTGTVTNQQSAIPQSTTGGTMTTNPTSLTDIALDIYRKTDPARAAILERGMNFLNGNLDYTQSPVWGASKNAAETQYRLARDQIMQNVPSGGRLLDTLSDTDTAKARTLTDAASNIGMDEYNKIYGMATGTPQQTISGLSSAEGSATSLQGYQMQQNAIEDASKNQLYGNLGQGVGEAWGGK